MNQSYNAYAAESLIPLLRVMNRELTERREALELLTCKLRDISQQVGLSKRERRIQEGHVFSEVASHKREMRITQRELKCLGCSVDESDPKTVHIPGEDGEQQGGYTWHVGECQVRTLLPD